MDDEGGMGFPEKFELKDHRLFPGYQFPPEVRYELRPVFDREDQVVEGLHAVEITLDNPRQYNSYTTDMVRGIIAAFQNAGMDREAVAVVFTGAGEKAFCTGGNTREYARYYAGRPLEYAQYMWLFNLIVTSILVCPLPVICRVNGMRKAGGQEIGMACDFSIAGDHAVFGQAGPKHGSAPIGGSTDFLPLFVGVERAMNSALLCKDWTARQAKEYGLITDCVPVYKDQEGHFITNPLLDDPQASLEGLTIDLSRLDEAVDTMITNLLLLVAFCDTKAVDEIRRPKWESWSRNFPSHRQWLALNMGLFGRAGFTAYDKGPKGDREVNFIELRRRLAAGPICDANLFNAVLPEGVEL